MPTISVYTRNVYGRTLVYPSDRAQAVALSTLTNGAKTLERRHLDALRSLGFSITQVSDPSAIVTLDHITQGEIATGTQ